MRKEGEGLHRPKKSFFLGYGFVVAVSLVFVFLFFFLIENSPTSNDGQFVPFKVEAGEPLSVTASRLEQKHLVRSGFLFRWFYQVLGDSRAFPSGTFQVPTGLSAGTAVTFFRSAKPETARVTIPEGWTAGQIARLLEEKGVLSASAFLKTITDKTLIGQLGLQVSTLEGLLFPDTYQFDLDEAPKTVVSRMVGRFQEETQGFLDVNQSTFEKELILASIVEREYRVPEEAPIIASVFLNRLTRRIPLASCATIEYILTEILGRPHPHRIYFVETQIPSPFNTYLNYGLPPSPICNPGLIALKAALQPAKTPYLFFVVANAQKGTHTFSSTWDQHEKAREAYLNSYISKD